MIPAARLYGAWSFMVIDETAREPFLQVPGALQINAEKF